MDFFRSVSDQICNRLSPQSKTGPAGNFKAQEIANLVWSFATLNYKADGMIENFAPYIVKMCSKGKGTYDEASIARCIKRQEVANIAWSCAVLEEYPKTLMPLLYTALFGQDGKSNPDHLKSIYNDDGIQKQAVMTMFYVSALLLLDQMMRSINQTELILNFPSSY